MGFSISKVIRKAKKVVSPVLSFLGLNPLVSLGVSLFLAWVLRP